MFSKKQAETLQDFTANGKYAAKDGLMPASAVYYFPLPILSFISAAVRGRNSPWQQGSFYPVRLTDTFSVLSARTLAFGRILPHTTGSLLLARKFPAFILQSSR
ncbi:hypothetical protein CXU03_08645 [Akkermansia muciniphila]|nr:hypothetical protein CXU03_08645 [Akkermansia muciniphila]